MGGQVIDIIKDFIVSILIIVCLVLILAVFFYDKISLSKVIPEAEEYELSQEMKKELEDTQLDKAEQVVVNYYIDAKDLKNYETTNEYVKGKSNPFATDTSYIDNSTTGNNTSSNTNFYDDGGMK